MVKPTKILANCTGFEWDQGSDTKNWERHNASTVECEHFFNKPIVGKRDKEHSQSENRYNTLGRTKLIGPILKKQFFHG